MDREALLKKIKNLLERTTERGASEAETLSAMKIAQKLIEKHNIEEAELLAASKRSDSLGDVSEECVRQAWQIDKHEEALLFALCELTGCSFYYWNEWKVRPKSKKQSYGKFISFRVVGLPTDTILTKLLFSELLIITKAMARALGIKKQFAIKKFCLGFAHGLHSQIRSEKAEERKRSTTNTTALVHVKKDMITKHLESKDLKTRRTRASTAHNSSEYARGYDEGRDYDLDLDRDKTHIPNPSKSIT